MATKRRRAIAGLRPSTQKGSDYTAPLESLTKPELVALVKLAYVRKALVPSDANYDTYLSLWEKGYAWVIGGNSFAILDEADKRPRVLAAMGLNRR